MVICEAMIDEMDAMPSCPVGHVIDDSAPFRAVGRARELRAKDLLEREAASENDPRCCDNTERECPCRARTPPVPACTASWPSEPIAIAILPLSVQLEAARIDGPLPQHVAQQCDQLLHRRGWSAARPSAVAASSLVVGVGALHPSPERYTRGVSRRLPFLPLGGRTELAKSTGGHQARERRYSLSRRVALARTKLSEAYPQVAAPVIRNEPNAALSAASCVLVERRGARRVAAPQLARRCDRSATRKPYDIDSLTDVALAVFARNGFDGASMDDVAAAAGITKAAIYHHVAGKEALLERGLRRALDALFGILDEPGARGESPEPRLRYIVRRVARDDLAPAARTERAVPHARQFAGRATERSSGAARVRPHRRRPVRRRRSARATCAPTSTRASDARLIFGMSNSVVEWYRPGREIDAERIAQAVEAVVFGGLRPE